MKYLGMYSIDGTTFQYISKVKISNKIFKFRMFSSTFGLLFCYNQVRSILFYMCNFRLANKYSKTVQTEVREYTIVVLPEPELGKLRKKV